ncbi:MAG: ribosome rescue GTPase HflX, partial [Haliea sp.]
MFFERPASGERAVLVHLTIASEDEREDPREFEELVLSAGGDPVAFVMGSRSVPDSRTFVGSGKLQEIADEVQLHEAEIVMFNHALSPSQERNLERELKCRVLDRTGLILDIFAQRARTHEGKLQVELAQLQHMSTRLVRGWTHLERQKGGIGLRGPGETQLETDRRLLRARIKSIQGRLQKVQRQRDQGRRSRRRAEVPTIELVGYTNAGKSTLFNRLTGSSVFAADQLFATLDPTLRRLDLEEAGPVILADTVGFIAHLPHKLVEAFKATLEETVSADLLLHVIDVAAEAREDNIHQVEAVLEEIGAADIPLLQVYNKLD